jgi:hypothetical protein
MNTPHPETIQWGHQQDAIVRDGVKTAARRTSAFSPSSLGSADVV